MALSFAGLIGAIKIPAATGGFTTVAQVALSAEEADIRRRMALGFTRDQAISQRKIEADALIAKEAQARAAQASSLLGKIESGANDIAKAVGPMVTAVATVASSPLGKSIIGLLPVGGDVVNLAISATQVISDGGLTPQSAAKIAGQAAQTVAAEQGVSIPPGVLDAVVSGNPQRAVTAITTAGLTYAANQSGIPVPPSVIGAVASGNFQVAAQASLQVSFSPSDIAPLLGATPPAPVLSTLAVPPGQSLASRFQAATAKVVGAAYQATDTTPKPYSRLFATRADFDKFASHPSTQGGTIGFPK
jgi:hypothetical protein